MSENVLLDALLDSWEHPILMLQHMIWHQGYHHGQIKLALKTAGRPMLDDEIGPVTWGVDGQNVTSQCLIPV